MSKKRKKKSGRRRPAPSRPQKRGPGQPKTNEARGTERERDVQARAAGSKASREAVRARRQAAQRRKQRRYIAIATAVLVLLLAFVGWRIWEGRQAISEHMALAEAAGCADVQSLGTQSRDHTEGRVLEYDTNPPVGGAHQASSLPARVFDEPFSRDPAQQPNIYQAVHSLEHGYVIVWHHGLDEDERRTLETELRTDHKTIVVPWPELEEHEGARVALTAWRHKQLCTDLDLEVVHSFIDLYREARTAPEPDAP